LLLPLHVFEERYRRMVRDLLELPDHRRRFAVVAIREGREVGADGVRALHAVGCVARVRRVDPYDDGRYDLVSVGEQRFRLADVDDSLPYLCADVELLDEPAGNGPSGLATAVRRQFET
jgi:Lon protease-like protein